MTTTYENGFRYDLKALFLPAAAFDEMISVDAPGEVFSGPSLEYVDIVFLSLSLSPRDSLTELLHLHRQRLHTHAHLEVDKPSERSCALRACD